MNNVQENILLYLNDNSFENQRDISSKLNISLGLTNKELINLEKNGYIDINKKLTKKAKNLIDYNSPKRAIILAAGICTRMVPINSSIPKALLKVNGKVLIEKQIEYLHEVGINEVYVIVGYMKEKFEYLIDKYDVKLIVNPQYNIKNNYYSLYLIKNKLDNAYIIPSDIVLYENPFSKYELYSWYMVSDKQDTSSTIRISKNKDIFVSSKANVHMIGIAYINSKTAKTLESNLSDMYSKNIEEEFWEEALVENGKYILKAKIVDDKKYYEINSYEDLRNVDSACIELENKIMKIISERLSTDMDKIVNICALKKGMTNRSFSFEVDGNKYIMRIPGEGTDNLISRENEYSVYSVLNGEKISDDVIFINPKNGLKLTKYIENARCCDSNNQEDLKLCMRFLRQFHNKNLKVNHTFDIFENIDFYEKLRGDVESDYSDYNITKKNVLSLKKYIEENIETKTLCHIDSVADNFLIYDDSNKKNNIRLIDFEYAGMQDPHVDIAMFCIYSLYEREQIDNLIDIYFENKCPIKTRIKIYCYIAVCGLLWSNWCEYKKLMGVEFGEYSLRQYRYAKDYYRIAINEMEKL